MDSLCVAGALVFGVLSAPARCLKALVGVHSAKATLLSWARQLNLSQSLRRIQGHRKPVGSESSVHLYGRDDIGPMLLLQQDIRKHIHSGFRPLQPLARGYSDPVSDFRGLCSICDWFTAALWSGFQLGAKGPVGPPNQGGQPEHRNGD